MTLPAAPGCCPAGGARAAVLGNQAVRESVKMIIGGGCPAAGAGSGQPGRLDHLIATSGVRLVVLIMVDSRASQPSG